MRRVWLVAAFVLVLTVPAVWGQMRGGMRAAPAAHFGGAVRGGGFSRGQVHVGVVPGMAHGGFHHPGGTHGCWNCGRSFGHFHHFRPWVAYGYPYYGYGYGYGYYGGLAYDTSYYDSSYSSDEALYQRQVASQVDQLSREVQDLREELRERSMQPVYAPAPQNPTSEAQPHASRQDSSTSAKTQPSRPELATVLVFRDQRIQEVKNYAIMGKNLVVVADQRQRKIPLADLDLAATTKLNEERGVDFQVPR